MSYKPLENEIAFKVNGVVGGTIKAQGPLIPMETLPLVVAVHSNSLFFEIEGMVGFSIDRDIAAALLQKISKPEKIGDRISLLDIDRAISTLDELLPVQDHLEIKQIVDDQHKWAVHLIETLGVQDRYEYSTKENGSRKITKR